MKLYFSDYFIVGNFITRDRNNTGGHGIKTWVLFVPGELDWGTLAPAASEGLGIRGGFMDSRPCLHSQVTRPGESWEQGPPCPEKAVLETAPQPPSLSPVVAIDGEDTDLLIHGFVPFGLTVLCIGI